MNPARLPPPPMILLRNADVYAPASLGRCDVLLAGGAIVGLAAHLDLPAADWQVEVVDLQGARLIPGFIDCHVHLAGGGGEAGACTRVPPVQLSQFTLAGVTTAVGTLGTDARTRSIAELLANARGLAEMGLTTYCFTGGYEVPPVTLSGNVRDDLVHNDRLIGVGELAISDHRSSQPTFDEFIKIAADCHVSGMLTGKAGVLHLHMGDGRRGLELVRRALAETELPPRTFHPTHVNRQLWLWEEAKALTSAGCTIDVTAFDGDAESLDAAQAIADYLQSGLDPTRLTVSSDGGGCIPTFDKEGVLLHMDVGRSQCLSDALVTLLRQGWPLERILPPFTSNPARLLRFANKGELRVGADADVVVLNEIGAPLHVIGLGRWLVRDGKALVRGLFEA